MDEIKQPKPLAKYIEETKYRVLVPFVVFNYPFRWIAYFLDKVAFLKVLEYIGLLSVIVAVYFYYVERDDRQKTKHYQAWQVINLAQGKPGNGGRTDALLDLYNDGVSLANIDLSYAILPGISLKNAYLVQANFFGANLEDADLSRSDIRGANLSGANFRRANLSGAKLSNAEDVGWMKASVSEEQLLVTVFSKANLQKANPTDLKLANFSGALSKARLSAANLSGAKFQQANLSEADLMLVNLSGAELWNANLSGAVLNFANLSDVQLHGANLSGAQLCNANLSGAELSGTDLSGADLCESDVNGIKGWTYILDIKNANIYEIRNAPEGFIKWAKEHGAISESRYKGEIFFKDGVQHKRNKSDDSLKEGISLSKRAKLKSDEKLFEEASKKFEQANTLKPNDYSVYLNWGACLSEWATLKGNENLFEQSYQKYEKAVKINPNGFEAYDNWGVTFIREARLKIGMPKYDSLLRKAEEKFLKAESLRKGFSAYNLACIYALRGDKEECRKWLLAGQETDTLVTRNKAMKDSDLDNVKNEPWFKEIKWKDEKQI